MTMVQCPLLQRLFRREINLFVARVLASILHRTRTEIIPSVTNWNSTMPTSYRRSQESTTFTMSRFVRATRLYQDDWGVIEGSSPTPVGWKVQPGHDQVHQATSDTASDSAVIEGSTSLSTLLAGRVLRDGEVVKMILKPSLWFIVYKSFFFIAAVIGCWFAYVKLGSPKSHSYSMTYGNVAIALVTSRIMLGTRPVDLGTHSCQNIFSAMLVG